MAKFQKKPIVIEATQWFKNGDHPLDYVDSVEFSVNLNAPVTITAETRREGNWEGSVVRYFRDPRIAGTTACNHCGNPMHNHGWIDTLEGGHIVCPADWIITGVNGEHYPCKPDIFEKTYSVVSDDPLDKLAEEHRQLLSKFSELAYFLDSEEYDQQPKKSRAILSRQYSALREYIFCLKEQLENNGCILFTGSNWPYLIEKFNGGVYQDDNTFLTPDGKVYLIGQWVK